MPQPNEARRTLECYRSRIDSALTDRDQKRDTASRAQSGSTLEAYARVRDSRVESCRRRWMKPVFSDQRDSWGLVI